MHDDTAETFSPMLEDEAIVLNLAYGHVKILETHFKQEGSVTGHAQRNWGMQLVSLWGSRVMCPLGLGQGEFS